MAETIALLEKRGGIPSRMPSSRYEVLDSILTQAAITTLAKSDLAGKRLELP